MFYSIFQFLHIFQICSDVSHWFYIAPTPESINPSPRINQPQPHNQSAPAPTPESISPSPRINQPQPQNQSTPTLESISPTPESITPSPRINQPQPQNQSISPSPESISSRAPQRAGAGFGPPTLHPRPRFLILGSLKWSNKA